MVIERRADPVVEAEAVDSGVAPCHNLRILFFLMTSHLISVSVLQL